MAKIISQGQILEDNWTLLRLAEGETAESVDLQAPLSNGSLIVPLAVWQARRSELTGVIGVWLDSHEGAEALAADLALTPVPFQVIALHFPKFTDGRAYSTAHLLRTRYGWQGQLRAFGDVLRDQFFYMKRCGFDTLVPKEGKYDESQLAAALKSLGDFSQVYQTSVDQPSPLFRRVQRQAA